MIKRWPILLLIILPLSIYWSLIFAGRVLYWGLPLYQFYPWHTLVVEAVRSGQLPLWTDLLGNGAPLLANHQSAVFYPLNLIYFVMPVEQAMGYSVVLHLILAGLFAYAWGQAIGLTRFGATVIGLSFGLSGFFVSRTQFITIVNGAAWLPLLFLFADRLIRRQAWLDAIWLGVILALQFLAGHAQLWFYSLWAVTAYALARIWLVHRRRAGGEGLGQARAWLRRGRILALLAGAFALALGLSAIQLLPTFELALYSQRVGGLDPDVAMTYSFWPWRLLTLAVPNLFGSPATGDYWGYATYWEDTGYIGVLPLVLASVAVWRWGRHSLSVGVQHVLSFIGRRPRVGEHLEVDAQRVSSVRGGLLTPFFLLFYLCSLILAMGHNTPVYPLVFEYVPGFGAFRAPARFLLFYTFGVSTMAGIGADLFRLTHRTRYVARLTVAGAGAMLAVSLAASWVGGQTGVAIRPTFAPAIAYFSLRLGLSAILLLLCPARVGLDGRKYESLGSQAARYPFPVTAWRGLIIGFIAADLAFFAAPLTPTIEPAIYHTLTNADRFLLARTDDARLFATREYDYNMKFNHYLGFSGWGPSDVAYWLTFRESLVPNFNVYSGTASVNNDEPLVVGRWRTLMDAVQDADWSTRRRLLRMMNVGNVLTQSPMPGLSLVEDAVEVYSLPNPLPRAWVVSQAQDIDNPTLLLSELMMPTFDPTTEVLLESAPYVPGKLGKWDLETGAQSADQPFSITVPQPELSNSAISLREAWNSRTINLIVPQPGYLVLAYTYYPGWHATVDGHPTEILRANYAFMALRLEPGEHQVVLHYRPLSLALGTLISGLAVLLIISIIMLLPRLLARVW
jgi:hypothetical protein